MMEIYVCHYTPNVDRRQYLERQNLELKFITEYDRESLDAKQIESWNYYSEASVVFSRIAPILLANILISSQKSINFMDALTLAAKILNDSSEKERFLKNLVKPLTISETSLFYKHLTALNHIANASQEYGVVIEDDCIFPNDAISVVKSVVSKYSHLYDYIDLAGGAGLSLPRTDQGSNIDGGELFLVDPPRTRTTCAYCISRRFAELVVERLSIPIAPIDHSITYLAQEFSKTVAWCEPPPLVHGSEVGAYRSNLR